MAENGDILLSDVDGTVLSLTLNRPDVMNALNGRLAERLRSALDRAAQGVREGSVRAIVITGAGRGFCAGADLGEPALRGQGNSATDLGEYLRQNYHPIIEQIRRIPAPVVVAVNGSAAGAGMSLAMAGDIVLAAQSASFLQAFSKIGLIPDAGSTFFLPRLVGESRARAMAMLAEKLNAEQARQFGLVWQVLPDDELQPAAHALAAKLAAMPTLALGLIKQALDQSLQNDLTRQLEVEAKLQSQAGRTEDFVEGVAAFLAKRQPGFKGR